MMCIEAEQPGGKRTNEAFVDFSVLELDFGFSVILRNEKPTEYHTLPLPHLQLTFWQLVANALYSKQIELVFLLSALKSFLQVLRSVCNF